MGGLNEPSDRSWFWEGHVQDALATHLRADGWDVRELANTETKAPGIDLLATKNERWLAVEVKGFPSTTYAHGPKRGQPKPTQPTNQARQWFSHALLGMMLLRDRRPDAEIAICFPDFPTYRTLAARTAVSFGLLGFGVYFVAENGSVTLAVAHRRVHAGMKTVGIDLSADVDETAACCIDWVTPSVRFLRRPITDHELVIAALDADVTAIDIPLGWPDLFVEALVAHREGREWPVADIAPPADRLKLKFRTTDEVVRALGVQPLSVAADRIGVAAMRGARLQHLLGQSGCIVDRTGLTGRVIETYPAAVLRAWKMQSSGYKGPKKIDVARALGAELAERCGSMRSPIMDGLSACDDDDLDALICAVVARVARLGLTTPPPDDLREVASREGWIHIPTAPIEDIISAAPSTDNGLSL